MILAGRALSLPLPEVGAPAEEIEYRLATADDGDLWKEHFPQKVDWYLERVRDPNQFCMLGITPGGELAVHCWYACGSFMDEDLGYRFETLEGCAYQGEGWVAPAHRRGGIAIECMRRVYNDILPARGFHTILCYFDATNMPSVKLHARLDFEERGRLRVLTLAGRNFFRMAETRA